MGDRKQIAVRLKAARSLAGYTNRRDFCAHFNIPYDTLDAWERGKNPLTLKGAKRIVESLRTKGIYCSEEWLRDGKGLSPRSLEEPSLSQVSDLLINPSASLSAFEKNMNLATEISTFITLNQGSTVTLVKDDDMLPFYKKGDYVGGIKVMGPDLHKALNKRCIVEFLDGETTVRQLQKLKSSSYYSLYTPHKKTKEHCVNKDLKQIAFAAPILWHRSFYDEDIE